MSIYFNNPWKPAKHSIIKDCSLAAKIENQGFQIENSLSTELLDRLNDLYKQYHNLKSEKGGMFYSIYSQNTDYRKIIHDKIGEILSPILQEYFKDYKMVLNSFVVKISGPQSEFYLHQDATGLDEWKYSPLSLWIPLQDVDINNGCLGIIPYSQKFFSPYRSISFPAPFDHIQSTVKQYLQPIAMKKGEVLIFDNRMLHHSYSNHSGKDRIAVICGLFPKEATMMTCHKPDYKCGGTVELIEHEEDFLLTGKNFLIDCQKRPDNGKSLGWVEDPYLNIAEEEFLILCENFKIEKITDKVFENPECEMIGEPKFKTSYLNKILNKIKLKS